MKSYSRFQVLTVLLSSILLATAMLPSSTQAADKKDNRQREAMRRMEQMKQQLEAEKAELQASFDKEKATLQETIDKSAKEASSLKAGLASANHRSKQLEADLEAVKQEKLALESKQQQTETKLKDTQSTLETSQKNLAELTKQYQDAQSQIKAGIADKKTQSSNLAQKEQRLAACDAKNANLYGLGRELIDYNDQHCTAEPFTQIKRVQLENIMQDYRDKLDEHHVTTQQNVTSKAE